LKAFKLPEVEAHYNYDKKLLLLHSQHNEDKIIQRKHYRLNFLSVKASIVQAGAIITANSEEEERLKMTLAALKENLKDFKYKISKARDSIQRGKCQYYHDEIVTAICDIQK
jgi:hypothetical protein